MIIATPNGISYAQLASLKGAVKLEALGMRHSSGKRMSAVAKKRLGLKMSTPIATAIMTIQDKMNELLEKEKSA
jgi:hypothetical protein